MHTCSLAHVQTDKYSKCLFHHTHKHTEKRDYTYQGWPIWPKLLYASLNYSKSVMKWKWTELGILHTNVASKKATATHKRFKISWEYLYQTTLKIQAVLCIQGYTGLQRSHLWEPESLSMPFRAFLDTMTKWSGAALFIFQLWPGASDTPVDRGKWKEGAAANGTVLYLPRDLAYPPAVWALPLNANNMAAEFRAREKRGLHGYVVDCKKLSTNFPCRGFRSCDVYECGVGICMTELIVECQNVKG